MNQAATPAEAYPLSWPGDWTRTPLVERKGWRAFKVSLHKARKDLLHELDLLGAERVILSTNVPLRKSDGMFYVNVEPIDPGVAVYFERKKKPQVLACDSYDGLTANVRAVGLTAAALRSIERYGATELLERAFTGFKALPAAKPWHEILGVQPTATNGEIEQAYRREIFKRHPDRGGTAEAIHELQAAMQQVAGRLSERA